MAPRPTPSHHRVAVAVLVAIAFLLIVRAVISPRFAELLVFHPDASDPGRPPTLEGVQGVEVELTAEDGVALVAWWWRVADDAPVVLFFHGNAGNVGTRTSTAAGMVARGISTLHLEYRGYGRSGGEPSEAGIYLDGVAALEWLAREVGGTERVVVHGRSLGGIVAAHLAARRPVAGLVLESSFTSLDEMAAAVYPFLPRFLFRRLVGRFDALSDVARVRAPILVIHGTDDDLVPFRMGEALHERASGPRELFRVAGAGHVDLPFVAGVDYFDQLASFARMAVEGGR